MISVSFGRGVFLGVFLLGVINYNSAVIIKFFFIPSSSLHLPSGRGEALSCC